MCRVEADNHSASQPSSCGEQGTITYFSGIEADGLIEPHSYLYIDHMRGQKVIVCDGDVHPFIGPSENPYEPLRDDEMWEHSYQTLAEHCTHTRRGWFVGGVEEFGNFWNLLMLRFKGSREPSNPFVFIPIPETDEGILSGAADQAAGRAAPLRAHS